MGRAAVCRAPALFEAGHWRRVDGLPRQGDGDPDEPGRAGRWLSQLARLVGTPLPLSREAGGAAVVTVTEDVATTGQHWTRLYARRGGFPQVIHSSKRFAGPTGLEEHIGCGLGMALRVETAPDAILFRSAGYFLSCGSFRLVLPRWLSPGDLTVMHRDLGDDRFLFQLRLDHPRFGELLYQAALFEDGRLATGG